LAPPATQESQHKMPNAGNVHWTGNEQIAMLIYPGVTAPDLIGPHSMFGALMGAKVLLVAKSPDPVTSDAGVTITPTATFETCPKDLTVLFTPGGTAGTLAAAVDPETRAFMADRGARAKYVTSVCSGSLIPGGRFQPTLAWCATETASQAQASPPGSTSASRWSRSCVIGPMPNAASSWTSTTPTRHFTPAR
jgi:putative intracellular protease/amidase